MIILSLTSVALGVVVFGNFVVHAFQQVPARAGVRDSASQQAQQHSERGYGFAGTGDLDHAATEFHAAATLDPDNAEYIYALGVILARQGKLAEAGDQFRRALKLDPSNLAIRKSLAASEWQSGKLVDAERNLRVILQQTPSDQDASFLLGMVLENRGEYAKALKLLATVQGQLTSHPESSAALLHCYYETAKLSDAHALEDSLLRDASQTQSIFLAARVAARAGDYSVAERMLIAIHHSYSSPADIDYELASVQYRQGHYSEAESTLQRAIAGNEQESKYFNLLAWCLAKQAKTGDAVKAFDRAIDLEPSNGSNYVDLATVLMDWGLLPPALEAANRAVEVNPRSYAAHRVTAQIQMKQHDYTSAVESYATAAQLNSTSVEPVTELADAEAAAGQFEKAYALLEKALSKYPRQAQLYLQYAQIILHHSGEQITTQSKATALLEKSLALDDSLAAAHYELGNIWLNQDQPVKAFAQLHRAEELDASDTNTHYALSLALRKMGRQQEAEEELQAFKNLKAQQKQSDVHR